MLCIYAHRAILSFQSTVQHFVYFVLQKPPQVYKKTKTPNSQINDQYFLFQGPTQCDSARSTEIKIGPRLSLSGLQYFYLCYVWDLVTQSLQALVSPSVQWSTRLTGLLGG